MLNKNQTCCLLIDKVIILYARPITQHYYKFIPYNTIVRKVLWRNGYVFLYIVFWNYNAFNDAKKNKHDIWLTQPLFNQSVYAKSRLIDWLMFNTNISSISAISWHGKSTNVNGHVYIEHIQKLRVLSS